MTREQLDAFLSERGFTVEDWHGGAGKFRDLYIGIGKPYDELNKLVAELRAAGIPDVRVSRVTNDQHEDYGKPMCEIDSFWDETAKP